MMAWEVKTNTLGLLSDAMQKNLHKSGTATCFWRVLASAA